MFVDVEETLGRELHEVAHGLLIPAMPPLPQEPPRARRHWQPMLVAAAADERHCVLDRDTRLLRLAADIDLHEARQAPVRARHFGS